MKWDVQTADANTGRERTITVDAPDATAAAEKVRSHGLLIQGQPTPRLDLPMDDEDGDPPPVSIEYEPPHRGGLTPAARSDARPRYDEITKASERLRTAAGIFNGLGVICVIVAVVVIVLPIITIDVKFFTLALSLSVSLFIYGAIFFAAAALFGWLASIAPAIREIAMNTRQ